MIVYMLYEIYELIVLKPTLSKLNCKEENNTSDIRYHKTTVIILQIGTRDKRKTQKGSATKQSHPLKAMQKMQTCGFFYIVIMIIIMRLFHVKGIGCVKDLIKLNR